MKTNTQSTSAQPAKLPSTAAGKISGKVPAKTGKNGSKVNRAWINDHVNDPYVKLAAQEGYRARAAYKLKEIDEAFHLIKPGQLVVDLGSAPGAWSQYLRRRMGPLVGGGAISEPKGEPKGEPQGEPRAEQGKGSQVIALDLLAMEPVDGVTFLQGDFREDALLAQVLAAMGGRKADLVVSDMAPNLSGIHSADAARVEHLIELAIDFTRQHMKPSGSLVAKVFHSGGYDDLVKLFKATFKVVKPYKPKASRDRSTETFLVGQGLKP